MMDRQYSGIEAQGAASRIRGRLVEAEYAMDPEFTGPDGSDELYNEYLSNSVLFASKLLANTQKDFQTLGSLIPNNDGMLVALSERLAIICANCCFMYCQVLDMAVDGSTQQLLSDERRMKETAVSLDEAQRVLNHVMASGISLKFASQLRSQVDMLAEVTKKFEGLTRAPFATTEQFELAIHRIARTVPSSNWFYGRRSECLALMERLVKNPVYEAIRIDGDKTIIRVITFILHHAKYLYFEQLNFVPGAQEPTIDWFQLERQVPIDIPRAYRTALLLASDDEAKTQGAGILAIMNDPNFVSYYA